MPDEQRELENMMSAAAEVERGKRPARIGMPRNHSPWTELSQDERVMQESAREVDEEDSRQSGTSGELPDLDERLARLDATIERVEGTLEENRERRERVADERIRKQLDLWGV